MQKPDILGLSGGHLSDDSRRVATQAIFVKRFGKGEGAQRAASVPCCRTSGPASAGFGAERALGR